jgi:hypothetical protein
LSLSAADAVIAISLTSLLLVNDVGSGVATAETANTILASAALILFVLNINQSPFLNIKFLGTPLRSLPCYMKLRPPLNQPQQQAQMQNSFFVQSFFILCINYT